MQHIGIFGGTFDPPHLGHINIANLVATQYNLHKIWFMPAHIPPHKKKAEVSAQHRIAMIERAIQSFSNFEVNTIEIDRLGKSYTVETMGLLVKKYPQTKFYFIIGADMVEALPQWKRIDRLLKLVTFIGVHRPGYGLKTPYPIETIETPSINISSTEIRHRIKNGQKVAHLLPEAVYAYIRENQLYGRSSAEDDH